VDHSVDDSELGIRVSGRTFKQPPSSAPSLQQAPPTALEVLSSKLRSVLGFGSTSSNNRTTVTRNVVADDDNFVDSEEPLDDSSLPLSRPAPLMSDNDSFAKFEDEFAAISTALARKLNSIPQQEDREAKAQLIAEAESDLADAENRITTIETGLRHYEYQMKTKCQQKVRECSRKLGEQKDQLQVVKSGAASRSFRNAQEEREWKSQRGRLLDGREIVNDTGQSLENTQRTLEETHAVGAAAGAQLVGQRGQLEKSLETLHETDAVLARARKLLIRMRRRVIANKLLTGIIILIELGVVGLIIWLKYFN